MFPTDQSTAASSLPTPAAAGTPGFFTGGNPASGIPATVVDPDWLNMIQQELINIVDAGGITPSKTTYTQVLSAIKRIGQNTVVLTDTGAANAYTAANAVPLVVGTWVDGVVQAVKIAHANTGPSTYAPDGLAAIPIYGLGLQPLQATELVAGSTAILMHATIASVNSGNPICILMECPGGTQQIPAGTQSNHAVNLGQFAASMGANGYTKLPNGLILQWGNVAANSSGLATLTFPIAFPNNLFIVEATYVNSGTGVPSSAITVSDTTATTKSAATLIASQGGAGLNAANIRVFAIGN
jgi:hypothetical protein